MTENTPPTSQDSCSVAGCGAPMATRGWCHGHYQRWRRTGDVRADRPLTRGAYRVDLRIDLLDHDGATGDRTDCSVERCGRVLYARHLCRSHYNRLARSGSLRAEEPIRVPRGESITHGYRAVPVTPAERHLSAGQTPILEHRLAMARQLGRPLTVDESVHHRNGDRLDNRPDNLELWSRWQPRGQRVEDKVSFATELLQRYRPELLANPHL